MDEDSRFPSADLLFGISGSGPPGGLSLAGTGVAARTLVGLLPLVNHVLRRGGVPDRDAPDLAQEVLVSVLLRLAREESSERLAPVEAWRSYLRVAAAHRASQYRRREARHGLRLGCDTDRVFNSEPSPEEWVLAGEIADALDPSHATTPERWRALHAHAVTGVPVAQLAQAEQVPSTTIYARIGQARRDLRAVLKRLRLL